MSKEKTVAGAPVNCPANKSTKVFSMTYGGFGYVKYTIKLSTTEKAVATKWYNGIPIWWDFYGTTTFTVLPGYTSVYVKPTVNCTSVYYETGLES